MARSQTAKPLVLLADDDPQFTRLVVARLRDRDYRVEVAHDKATLLRVLDEERPAVLMLDVRFGEHDGVELLQELLRRHPGLYVLMLTAHGSIESAVTAIKLGAGEYLSKPIDFARLSEAINHGLDRQESAEAPPRKADPGTPLSRPIWGDSPAMRELRRLIETVATTDATALVLGESGTGKELVARALHELSFRRRDAFIPVNMAALPRELAESTLFGHEKGAFTGAERLQRGCCELADGGTLFLDEIGEMDLALQAKLLRFLQEQTIQRVGASEPIRVDVRIVAATNRRLREMVRRGEFREDLYYRLNVVPIKTPPLRERREDIPVLAENFLRLAVARYRKDVKGFAGATLDALCRYDWPGNVRQLENMVDRLVILNDGPRIEVEAFRVQLRTTDSAIIEPAPAPATAPSPVVEANGDGHGDGDLRAIDRVEKHAIVAALKECRGSVRDAARKLGLSQATIYRKIKRYGIQT